MRTLIMHYSISLTLMVVLFLGISLMLFYTIQNPRQHFDIDSDGYQSVAVNFQKYNSLHAAVDNNNAPIQPIGYPFLLGMLYKINGPCVPFVVTIQILIMLFIFMLILSITHVLFNKSIIFCLVILFCVTNVGFLVYPQFILAEVFTLLFVLLFFERYIRAIQQKNTLYLMQAGLALGFSVLVKPIALFYSLIVGLITFSCTQGTFLYKVSMALLLMACWATPLCLYMGRNYYCYNTFSLAPMTALNIYQCFLSKVIAQVEHKNTQDVIEERLRFKGTHSFDQHGWDHVKPLLWFYVTNYPYVCVQVWVKNVLKTLFGLFSTQLKMLVNPGIRGGAHSFFKMQGSFFERVKAYIFDGSDMMIVQILSLYEAIWSLLRYLFVIIGLYALYKQKQYMILSLFISFIMQCAFITGMDGCGRYRLMFEPLLIIVASLGIYHIYTWLFCAHHVIKGK